MTLGRTTRNNLYPLGVILLLAALHGLVYIGLARPWQHYDEPNHFEYAWLIAHRGSLPQPEDYDQNMRREVARSMVAHDFFRNLGFLPDLTSTDQPIWIGTYSQLGDPPMYYILAAIPMVLIPTEDVTTQLYLTRLVSLVLFLLSVVAGWGVICELTQEKSALRWMVPLTMALLPSFVDLMTSVNSDVAAVGFFSLFLWGSVRLIRRGFSFWAFVSTGVMAGLCAFTKANVFVAVPLLGIVMLLALTPERGRKWAWGTLVLVSMVTLVGIFNWDETAFWYRDTTRSGAMRVVRSDAPEGNAALAVQGGSYQQLLSDAAVRSLQGKQVTLGAWVWADQPGNVSSPIIHVYENNQDYSMVWSVSTIPAFYTFSISLPVRMERAWVKVASSGSGVYFDGLVLCEGVWEQENPGSWRCPNYLQNPSAEAVWPGVRSWADNLISCILPDRGRPSVILYSLLDLEATGWYYRTSAANLLRSFWAKFGWGDILLLGKRPYLILGISTLLGVIGAGVAFLRKDLPWSVLLFLGMALLAVWGMTLVRGAIYLLIQVNFIPGARYAFPVIIPTVIVLAKGWQQCGRYARRWLQAPDWVGLIVFGGFFIILDVWALLSLMRFNVSGIG